MQFAYQHRQRCERLVLIGSSGLEPELNWTLRVLSARGLDVLAADLEKGFGDKPEAAVTWVDLAVDLGAGR